MALLNENIQNQIKEMLSPMKENVRIILFTQENCESCPDTQEYMKEIEALSDKLSLEVADFNDREKAERYSVEYTPAIVLVNDDLDDKGVKFYGIPAGHEINSLLTSIMEVSGSGEPLEKALSDRLSKLENPVDIKVFVTLGCPHCPGAVVKAHKLALSHPMINAQMIEANTFDELSDKYNVSSVPRIIINETGDILGNQPMEEFVKVIESFIQ